MSKKALFGLCMLLSGGLVSLKAQDYTGISGLVHVPTAEIQPEGEARFGSYYLNSHFLPDNFQHTDIGRYNTFNYFLALAPFSWMEISYVCTFFKAHQYNDPEAKVGYYMKDRHFNVKLRPLKEGRYWPAIAVGAQDPTRSVKDSSGDYTYFQNFYAVASKHLDLQGHELSAHLAYRYYRSDLNRKWRGVAGGVAYRPAFAHNLRVTGEYTNDAFIVGADCLLWRHLFLQASLQDGKYFSGGLSLQMNLF